MNTLLKRVETCLFPAVLLMKSYLPAKQNVVLFRKMRLPPWLQSMANCYTLIKIYSNFHAGAGVAPMSNLNLFPQAKLVAKL